MTIPDFFALSPYKNPPAVERILELIWQLQDACEQQTWQDHWHEDCTNCPCLFCEHAGGLWWFLRNMESTFADACYVFPAMYRRRATRSREAGNPADLENAESYEAQATKLEREAGEPTNPPPADGPPVLLAARSLLKEARADNPFISRSGPA